MSNLRKSMLWMLAGVVIGLVALSLLGGQALAQDKPPAPDDIISSINIGSPHFGLNWNTVGTGGGTISSAHFTVSSTIGQPTVGTVDSPHFEVCTGYWCWLGRIADIFLPIVMKN
jgi:hypothetical protein